MLSRNGAEKCCEGASIKEFFSFGLLGNTELLKYTHRTEDVFGKKIGNNFFVLHASSSIYTPEYKYKTDTPCCD
jgi:hypothetical protein